MESLDKLKQVVPAEGPDNALVRVDAADVAAVIATVKGDPSATVAALKKGVDGVLSRQTPLTQKAQPVYQQAGDLRHLIAAAGG